MKKVFLALIFCFFSASVFAQNQFYDDGFCANLNYYPPIMNFTTSYGKLTYDFSKNTNQLTSQSNRGKTGSNFSLTTGLASCPFHTSIKTDLVAERVGRRRCVFVSNIDVFYGYKNPVIYVTSEHEEGTCRFQKTLRHERQHMAIYILGLEYFIPKIRAELEKEFLAIKPREYINQEHLNQIVKEMREEHQAIVRKYSDKYSKIMDDWHDLMDNDENYRKESLICLKIENPKVYMYKTLDEETHDYTIDY